RSSTSTLLTRRRPRSLRAMWASRLSMRRAGPERWEVKNTSSGCSGVTSSLLACGNLREQRAKGARGYGSRMGAWYWIGVSAGLGAAVGILIAAAAGAGVRVVLVVAGVAAVVAGALVGFGVDEYAPGGWEDIVLGVVGAVLGLLSAALILRGALRRGGTRGGTGALVAGSAFVVAALAWIPAARYVIVIVLLVFAVRVRRAQPERYAGLRTLARDE